MGTEIGDEVRLYSPRLRLTTGDRYRLLRKTTTYTPERPKEVVGEFANKRDRLSKLLTRATRDLSVVTNTPQGYRSVSQYGGSPENFAAESAGSTFRSADVNFHIGDESAILDAKLNFIITGYRADIRLGVADIYDIVTGNDPPGPITVKMDGAIIYGPEQIGLGEKRYMSLTDSLSNPGWHTLNFSTTSGKARVTPYILVYTLQF